MSVAITAIKSALIAAAAITLGWGIATAAELAERATDCDDVCALVMGHDPAEQRAEWDALSAWLETRSCDVQPAAPRTAAFVAAFCDLGGIQ